MIADMDESPATPAVDADVPCSTVILIQLVQFVQCSVCGLKDWGNYLA